MEPNLSKVNDKYFFFKLSYDGNFARKPFYCMFTMTRDDVIEGSTHG